jgi:hypothetical protein
MCAQGEPPLFPSPTPPPQLTMGQWEVHFAETPEGALLICPDSLTRPPLGHLLKEKKS